MKELPDLSRIMAARTSAKKGGSGGEVNPPCPRENVTISAAGMQAPKEGTSQKAAPKKKKKKQDPEALEEHRGEGPSEQARTGDGSKKGKKKKRKDMDAETKALRVAVEDPEEPSSEDVPLKKRRKKKETNSPDPRPCARRSSGFWCPTSESPEVADRQKISGNPIDSLILGERRDHLSEENSSHVPEGSETAALAPLWKLPRMASGSKFNRSPFLYPLMWSLIRRSKGVPSVASAPRADLRRGVRTCCLLIRQGKNLRVSCCSHL
ncbi:hypothetical protein Bca52824_018236 [Brassica carinata]|uniref:Uncharacterized protein n=1 Tax=Brassica carinata TaxID=52824 RepID=A0A8X8AW78_BRACI|nr:hypothetical protein Bca52824_018236 [Brassica carinata]